MSVNLITLKLYWQQIRQHKLSFFTALILIPTALLTLDTITPLFFSQAIGQIGDQNYSGASHFILLASISGVTGVLFNFIGFQALVRHEGIIRYKLSRDIFGQLIAKDLKFFINEKVGALTSRYIDFLRSHVDIQDLLIIRTLGFVLSVTIGLVVVGLQSPMLALVLLALIAGIIIEVKYSIKYRTKYRIARKELAAESNGQVADALSNNLIVKTFASEDVELDNINRVNALYHDAYKKDLTIMAGEGSLRLLIMVITQIVAISACVSLVSSGIMDVATAVFILIYLQRIGSQIFNLGEMLTGYDQALLNAAPISEMLSRTTSVTDTKSAKTLKDFSPTIEFSKVSYSYDSGTEVIKNMNFVIKPGEKVGIVGNSGSGKTTMTHLMLRFADPTTGTISIGGHDISKITQKSLRQNIAYVPQDSVLFHRSLRQNITYGKPDATDDELQAAIQKAKADEFINPLPLGVDTLVGERGVKLSGGQRQRIAIARAILKDAPILILDEATSALDSESERFIQDALWELMKDRTSIVIAHRLSTIARMDRILVINDGAIVEQGSHEQLIHHSGEYAKLWTHQNGGFIK
jgi:ATP-binding cassette, subfamily B, bacterial